MAQHQAKIDEAIEQAKALAKAMRTGKMATAEIMAANQKGGSMLFGSRASVEHGRKHKVNEADDKYYPITDYLQVCCM